MSSLSQAASLSQVLPLLSDLNDAIIINKVKRISTNRVVAQVWHEGRLKECRERLAAGERAPMIRVSAYILNGKTWYIPSDGNHRTIAAQEAGKKQMTALVGCVTECKTNLYVLNGHTLWRLEKDENWFLQIQTHIPEEIQEALVEAGVRRQP